MEGGGEVPITRCIQAELLEKPGRKRAFLLGGDHHCNGSQKRARERALRGELWEVVRPG